MLDAFAAVLVENDKTASLEDELVHEFKKLASAEEVQAVANELCEVKNAYSDGDYCWLTQYEGSPLYQQAVDLEEQGLNIEAARIKSRMEKKEDNWYAQEDMIRLKKKLLDLELSKSKLMGGREESAKPAAPVSVAAEPPPDEAAPSAAPPKKAEEKPAKAGAEAAAAEEPKVASIQIVDLAGRSLAHAFHKQASTAVSPPAPEEIPKATPSIDKYASAVRVGIRPFVGSLEKRAFFGALASKAMPMLGNAATQVGSSIVGDKAAKTLGGVEKFVNPVKALPAVAGTALQGLGKITPVIGGAVGKVGKLITPS